MKLSKLVFGLMATASLFFVGCEEDKATGIEGTWHSTLDEDGMKTANVTTFSAPDKYKTVMTITSATKDGVTYSGAELDAILETLQTENPVTLTGTWKTEGDQLTITNDGQDPTTFKYSVTATTLTTYLPDGKTVTATRQ